jgi:hypothetical protein
VSVSPWPGLTKLYEAADESRKIGALTTQVIKTTGGAAQISAKQVGDLAGAIAAKTGIDDEAIQSGENLLLTFTNVQNKAGQGNDVFNQATKIMTDMSAALGGDASGSAIQLGKALNDPVKGVTALQKVGVSFTAAQKDQIKTLVKSGDTLGAQKIILGELNKEFGGAAEAAATPLGKLQQKAGDVAEKLGGFLLPAVDKGASFLIDKFLPGVSRVADQLGTKLGPFIAQAGGFITTQLIPAITSLWNWLAPRLMPILSEVGGIIGKHLVPAFKAIWAIVQNYVIPIFKSVLGPALEGVRSLWKSLGEALDRNKEKFAGILEKVKPMLAFLRDHVAPFIGGALKTGFEAFGKVIGKVIDSIAWILDKAADVTGFLGTVGGKVADFFSAPGGGSAPAPAPAGASRSLFGAARGGSLFAASSSLGGGGAGPSAALQGLGGTVVNVTINGAVDPVSTGRQLVGILREYGVATGGSVSVVLAR